MQTTPQSVAETIKAAFQRAIERIIKRLEADSPGAPDHIGGFSYDDADHWRVDDGSYTWPAPDDRPEFVRRDDESFLNGE